MSRAPALVILVLCTGCVSTSRPVQDRAAAPAFDPVAFFAGHTEGRGVLKIALHRRQTVLVEGHGHVTADGAIVLEQTVRRGDSPETTRRWYLYPDGPGRYAGTLTDAAGPVGGTVAGNCLHLAFAMKGGTQAQQWLYLTPDGQTAHNVLIVRKFGLPVARLDETITRHQP